MNDYNDFNGKIDIDELAEYLIKGCILMFEMLEDRHNAEPIICMTAKTSRGEYTIKVIRENNK